MSFLVASDQAVQLTFSLVVRVVEVYFVVLGFAEINSTALLQDLS
jgi:hypothetical protein